MIGLSYGFGEAVIWKVGGGSGGDVTADDAPEADADEVDEEEEEEEDEAKEEEEKVPGLPAISLVGGILVRQTKLSQFRRRRRRRRRGPSNFAHFLGRSPFTSSVLSQLRRRARISHNRFSSLSSSYHHSSVRSRPLEAPRRLTLSHDRTLARSSSSLSNAKFPPALACGTERSVLGTTE